MQQCWTTFNRSKEEWHITYLRQPRPPPGIVVLGHLLPVVGREAPVLAVRIEVVGGGARRRVHAKEVRELPRVDAVAVDADGQVALEDDAVGACVVGGLFQLQKRVSKLYSI